ncbi:hypothetical protein OKA04_13280 [Luteolibacter flavescens]|uniref:Lipoprotein n=1 Tax=Luteolibacter flavescens TaxID=1859460 RepID=A0ABT3FQ49_9BACT|nr:hypothetical protein [Luteolibacter flavescens]MCW1885706.1 hypothetical protein [Luteolibacter flavescens]
MNLRHTIALAAACLITGCGNPIYQASRLPGLKQASDSMNERAFVEWMESDPAPQVRARVAKGEYRLLGLAIYDTKDYWIPGVAGHAKEHDRYDVTWQGMGGSYGKHIPLAESYMARFNAMMLKERKGVPLDIYARGPQHEDYAGPVKKR